MQAWWKGRGWQSQTPHMHQPIWELFAVSACFDYLHTWIRRRNRRGCSFLGIIGNKVDQFCGQTTGSLRQPMQQFVMLPQTPQNYDSLNVKRRKAKATWPLKISKNFTHQTLLSPRRTYASTNCSSRRKFAGWRTHKHTHTHTNNKDCSEKESHGFRAKSFPQQEQLYDHPVLLAGLETLPLLLKKLAKYL